MAKVAATARPMTKSGILDHIAAETELTKKQTNAVLDSLIGLAYKEAKKGFTIPGLGKFVVGDRKARMGRNPLTGEAIKIAAKKTLKFRVAKQAKDAVLGVKAAPKAAPAKKAPAKKK